MHLFHASLELSPPQSHLTQTVRGQVNLDFAKKKNCMTSSWGTGQSKPRRGETIYGQVGCSGLGTPVQTVVLAVHGLRNPSQPRSAQRGHPVQACARLALGSEIAFMFNSQKTRTYQTSRCQRDQSNCAHLDSTWRMMAA